MEIPNAMVADRLFVIDPRRITCSRDRASIEMAAAILLRHPDIASVRKALRILLVGEMQKGDAPQPHLPGLKLAGIPKVTQAAPMIHHAIDNEATAAKQLRFGIVLLPNFTLTAFSSFVDLLRLASDEGDMSRPVRCSWTIVGENLAPVRASCGIQITPWTTFSEAEAFDYVVIVGGLLHSGPAASDATLTFIRAMAETPATLVGLCTGAFALARAGIMTGYRICVSWFHYWDFVERFPHVDERELVADRLFVIDRRRITCSGGRASIDVAAAILLRHVEASIVRKALRILLVDDAQKGNAPQPHLPGLEPATHPKIRRAILLMEQHVGQPLSLPELARRLDVSVRQLERIFTTETGKSPSTYARQIRLRMASWLLTSSDRTVAAIASSCGFSDASHLGREFRKEFAVSPNQYRTTRLPNASPSRA